MHHKKVRQRQSTCKERWGSWLWIPGQWAWGPGPDGCVGWWREARSAGVVAQQRGDLDPPDKRRGHWPTPPTPGFGPGVQCREMPKLLSLPYTGPSPPLTAASGNPFCALKRAHRKTNLMKWSNRPKCHSTYRCHRPQPHTQSRL